MMMMEAIIEDIIYTNGMIFSDMNTVVAENVKTRKFGGNLWVSGNFWVSGNLWASGKLWVSGNLRVSGNFWDLSRPKDTSRSTK